jgi:hypothetical protein
LEAAGANRGLVDSRPMILLLELTGATRMDPVVRFIGQRQFE